MRRGSTILTIGLIVASFQFAAIAQQGPDFSVRDRTRKSLVYIRANGCSDGSERVGTGFTLEDPGRIITAHHVVGGCTAIHVEFEAIQPPAPKIRTASVQRVFASGDLALLRADSPPSVPVLSLASPPPDRDKIYAGFGYQNGQRTAGDQAVTFSTGASTLRDVLPDNAVDELRQSQTKINLDSTILRFNVALQPGMSGGPIVDSDGKVIGVVAGGLKAGAATASWGWPSEWIPMLLASNERIDQRVTITRAYYSLSDMDRDAAALRSGRQITCGTLNFVYRGRQKFSEVARGADDQQRLQYILAVSTRPRSEIDEFEFDIWVHLKSGATAVTPAGYQIQKEGDVCAIHSMIGPFRQVIWSSTATDATSIQMASSQFEQNVMYPRAPYPYGASFDPVLTTAGAQFRDNGMVFNRKGFTQPKVPVMPGAFVPTAHTFETLTAKSGSFLGVGTLNDDLHPNPPMCITQSMAPGCPAAIQYLLEWTKFILATQLSTYPST